MLQRIDLCKFQAKQAYALASVGSFTNENGEKQRKVYNQQEIHTLQKTHVLCSLRILFKRFALLY